MTQKQLREKFGDSIFANVAGRRAKYDVDAVLGESTGGARELRTLRTLESFQWQQERVAVRARRRVVAKALARARRRAAASPQSADVARPTRILQGSAGA